MTYPNASPGVPEWEELGIPEKDDAEPEPEHANADHDEETK